MLSFALIVKANDIFLIDIVNICYILIQSFAFNITINTSF